MRVTLIGAALTAAVLLRTTTACAEDYHPGFACPRPEGSDPLTAAICSDPAMARAELILEKTYYAHREWDGPPAFGDLKVKAAAIDKTIHAACGISAVGIQGPIPSTVSACYVAQATKQAANWANGLYGPAGYEAQRDIDFHIALQRKMVSDGLLPDGAADGVYGDGTREAIIAWQRSKGLKTTGFLSDLQASQLMASAAPVSPLSAQQAAEQVQTLFTRDMLGVRVPFLETLLGPARRSTRFGSNHEARSYRVAGCDVTAYAADGNVYGYALDISRACHPDLSELLNTPMPTSWPATFGTFAKAMPGTFQATCLTGCGNAADPLVLLRVQGPHSNDFVNLEISVPLADERSLQASGTWQAAMRPSGASYAENGHFNCDTRYEATAEQAFAAIGFTHLFVGHDEDEVASDIDKGCSRAF